MAPVRRTEVLPAGMTKEEWNISVPIHKAPKNPSHAPTDEIPFRHVPPPLISGLIRPFICKFPGCESRFSQKSALKTHSNIHSGATPYGCPMCSSAFRDPSHLNLKKMFICEQCPTTSEGPRAFKRKDVLRKHMKVKHGASLPASTDNTPRTRRKATTKTIIAELNKAFATTSSSSYTSEDSSSTNIPSLRRTAPRRRRPSLFRQYEYESEDDMYANELVQEESTSILEAPTRPSRRAAATRATVMLRSIIELEGDSLISMGGEGDDAESGDDSDVDKSYDDDDAGEQDVDMDEDEDRMYHEPDHEFFPKDYSPSAPASLPLSRADSSSTHSSATLVASSFASSRSSSPAMSSGNVSPKSFAPELPAQAEPSQSGTPSPISTASWDSTLPSLLDSIYDNPTARTAENSGVSKIENTPTHITYPSTTSDLPLTLLPSSYPSTSHSVDPPYPFDAQASLQSALHQAAPCVPNYADIYSGGEDTFADVAQQLMRFESENAMRLMRDGRRESMGAAGMSGYYYPF
ncbi:hypothetical protein DL93DRAFT_2098049 [Clavulina sp. PMI_390]|nr:hypothetical protein DL93DRAFT_2098049 [Clavulina sp. PMI_390]